MNKPRMDWSPIQLRLVNQSKVLPIGRLTQVHVEVGGLRTYAYFEVIDIVDEKNTYPVILGIDWAIITIPLLILRKLSCHLKILK